MSSLLHQQLNTKLERLSKSTTLFAASLPRNGVDDNGIVVVHVPVAFPRQVGNDAVEDFDGELLPGQQLSSIR
jgi:hypothetical protein